MALEGLYVPTGAAWYPAFHAELLGFPAGKHDDQVDALGLVGQLLDKMMRGKASLPKVEEPKHKLDLVWRVGPPEPPKRNRIRL
jgi:hypothetical protein